MKPTLQLKVSQHLTLTPQLQQSIKLLQLSTPELQTEVERLLLENPLIERADDTAEDAGARTDADVDPAPAEPDTAREEGQDTQGDWGTGGGRRDDGDDYDPLANVPVTPTLREHLIAQLGEVAMPHQDSARVRLLIEELDEDGYLPADLPELVAQLPEELDIGVDEMAVALRLLQQFDPPGVAARNLAESLRLQLLRREDTPERRFALELVDGHLALLGNRDYTKLRKLAGGDDNLLRAARHLIATLNPRPAAGFSGAEIHYVVPDITVRKRGGRWVAQLNQAAIPRLQVNPVYARMLAENRQNSSELTGRLQEARWFVKNIQQRFDTILKVSEAIVQRQQTFFEEGEVAMRPLILRDIAEEVGLHESTVSRVTTQKYLQCPRGVFELKYFFGSALETDSGEECSATAIKAHIRRLIDTENPARPLSDNALSDELGRQGIQVARRTVAKYREAMQIPPANQRKAL
ncbi:RNA polymerase factor sigma-54 [Paludibacterium paludis]|uniref:RNA polymerase sigma-54 factor n=1 Tax=Paludibacterium paludis TaxID=1225769 RepID=A0A918NX07_9NEIS|nr:RNA polymerase factor sigma-54 [Paludibacterium paludis]GGY02620.1 RNA polymerase sigma-54 factor [Paludibacterium paludis]